MDLELTAMLMRKVLRDGLGLDLTDPNLEGTPERIAKMYCRELFSGLRESPPKITMFPNTDDYDELILMDNIPFVSVCSHHFLPFQGLAWFLYIPNEYRINLGTELVDLDAPTCEGELCGASKMARLINYYSARPQLQERLTKQILEHFVKEVKPLGAMLVMRAVHGCMSCRGVKTGNGTGMMTSKVYGSLKENPSTKNEALQLINISIKLSK
jgi:GTP cyclohydrolase I